MYPTHIFWTRKIKDTTLILQSVSNLYLSFLKLKQSHEKVFLMTDFYGKYLIVKLNIPYDHVFTDLEMLANEEVVLTDVKVFAFKSLVEKGFDFVYYDFRLKYYKGFQNASAMSFIFLEKVKKELSSIIFPELPNEFEPYKKNLCFLNVFQCPSSKVILNFYESYFSKSYRIQHDYSREKVDVLKELFFMGCILPIVENIDPYESNNNIMHLTLPKDISINSLINNFEIANDDIDVERDYLTFLELCGYPRKFSELLKSFKEI